MACDNCGHRRTPSPERLDERLTRLEAKTHIGDVFAVAVLFALVCWAAVKLMDKAGVPLDG